MIDVGQQPSATKTRNKLSILLMDGNSERRALRKRIVALHGVEVVGACDLTEAASIWRRDPCNALAPVELAARKAFPNAASSGLIERILERCRMTIAKNPKRLTTEEHPAGPLSPAPPSQSAETRLCGRPAGTRRRGEEGQEAARVARCARCQVEG